MWILWSFLEKIIILLIPMKYPLMYEWTNIEDFKRLLSWLWEKQIGNLLSLTDIYIWLKLEEEIKNRMTTDTVDEFAELKLQWVATFREMVSEFIQIKSLSR